MQYRQDVKQTSVQRHKKYLAQSLRPIVCGLENFHRKFANLVALPTDGTIKHLLRYKVHTGL